MGCFATKWTGRNLLMLFVYFIIVAKRHSGMGYIATIFLCLRVNKFSRVRRGRSQESSRFCDENGSVLTSFESLSVVESGLVSWVYRCVCGFLASGL